MPGMTERIMRSWTMYLSCTLRCKATSPAEDHCICGSIASTRRKYEKIMATFVLFSSAEAICSFSQKSLNAFVIARLHSSEHSASLKVSKAATCFFTFSTRPRKRLLSSFLASLSSSSVLGLAWSLSSSFCCRSREEALRCTPLVASCTTFCEASERRRTSTSAREQQRMARMASSLAHRPSRFRRILFAHCFDAMKIVKSRVSKFSFKIRALFALATYLGASSSFAYSMSSTWKRPLWSGRAKSFSCDSTILLKHLMSSLTTSSLFPLAPDQVSFGRASSIASSSSSLSPSFSASTSSSASPITNGSSPSSVILLLTCSRCHSGPTG
mmetsp:Transcript_20279/g.45775  ORF Transcript_20279/g.45775 Transcript_20279/m.45775 type:complete len:328 (-) Transcript_20279:41-1024(-)